MLAAFGTPGPIELLIIVLICLMAVGVPVLVIAIVLLVNRKNRRDGEV